MIEDELQAQIWDLFKLLEKGKFKKYENPTMQCIFDRIIQVGLRS